MPRPAERLRSLAEAAWIEPFEPVVAAPGERPVHALRLPFRVEVAGRARLLATAHGIAEFFLNGVRLGDHELVPGFASYRRRLPVVEFDAEVVAGENVLGVLLADGWFRGRHGFTRQADGFGDRVAVLAALLADSDTRPLATTGPGWSSRPSWIERADLMDGQWTDLGRRDEAWCRAGASEQGWHAAPVAPITGLIADRDRFVDPAAPPIRVVATREPVSVREVGSARVLDFGINLVGRVRLGERGPAGTRLTLTHGEALAADGTVTTENLRGFDFATGTPLPAGQVDVVVSDGGTDPVESTFTSHGFRYVQIDGLPPGAPLDGVRAVVLRSDLAPAGGFDCDHPGIQRLWELAVRSFEGNAVGIPTDCPTRERSGFTGDWQVFAEAATRMYDVRAFSEDWLADVEADQWPDGRVPTIAPDPAGGGGPSGNAFEDLAVGSAGWGDASVFVPWQLYRAYGDPGILRRWLPMMTRWVDYAAGAAASGRHPDRVAVRPDPAPHERWLWDTGFHFGEWLEPGVAPDPDPTRDRSDVATAYLHRSAALLARAAEIVGESGVAARARRIAIGARDAWRTEFLRPGGRIAPESQAAYARALAFGLVPDDLRGAAADRLADLVDAADGHLTTGFLSTGLLLPALADHGRIDAAYRVLTATGVPSWLEMVERRATTIWEWWDGVAEDGSVRGSLNHYAKGAVACFLHTHVAGLRIPEDPDPTDAGFRRVEIAPRPGGGISRAATWQQTARGRIEVAWHLEAGALVLRTDIPHGVEAEYVAVDGTRTRLLAGSSVRRLAS